MCIFGNVWGGIGTRSVDVFVPVECLVILFRSGATFCIEFRDGCGSDAFAVHGGFPNCGRIGNKAGWAASLG